MFHLCAAPGIRAFAAIRGGRRGIAFAVVVAGFVSQNAGVGVAPPTAHADFKVNAIRPPSAADRVVRVPAGGSVEIELRGRGSPGQSSLLFLLRSAPARGDLGELRPSGRDTAVVTYRHRDPGEPSGSDSFTYAVRAEGSAVSAAATVRVEIAEAPPRVVVVSRSSRAGEGGSGAEGGNEALDFGAVPVGQETRRELTLANAGGGVASGTLEPAAPWRLEVVGVEKAIDSYRLGRGERQRVTLVFRPGVARFFEGTMKLDASSTSDELVVRLTGTGLPDPASATPTLAARATVEEEGTRPETFGVAPKQPAVGAQSAPADAMPLTPAATPVPVPPEKSVAAAAPSPRATPRPITEISGGAEIAPAANRSPILGLELLRVEKKSLTIGWTYPSTPPRAIGPWPVRYRAELQRVRRETAAGSDGANDIQADWILHENVTWSSQGGEAGGAQSWQVTLLGLRPATTEIVRVVGLDDNGNAFSPSPFLIVTTERPARLLSWLTMPKLLLAALAICAGLLWRQRRAAAVPSASLRT